MRLRIREGVRLASWFAFLQQFHANTSGIVGTGDDDRPHCILERLQHEPFWDWEEAPSRQQPMGACKIDRAYSILKQWSAVRQYLEPQAGVAYREVADEQVKGFSSVMWLYPSWQSKDGPTHETMTLSDGLNSIIHLFKRQLKTQRWHEVCTRSFDCMVALFVSEAIVRVRRALARDSQLDDADVESLQNVWPAQWPWADLLARGWGLTVLGILISLSRVSRRAPLSNWRQANGTSTGHGSQREGSSCCDWEQSTAKLLMANAEACKDFAEALQAAPSVQCCGNIRSWLLDGLAALHLASNVLSPRSLWPSAKSTGSEVDWVSSTKSLTHVLCDDILRLRFADGLAALHVHGGVVFTTVDASGRVLARHAELLYFIAGDDDCVRLTVYGNSSDDQVYYAHALTLPQGHAAVWRCSVSSGVLAESSSGEGAFYNARSVSFFGYDSVLYCPVPEPMREATGGGESDELLVQLSVDGLGSAGELPLPPVRFCPVGAAAVQQVRVAACTQPLHGYANFSSAAPSLLHEFLEYHFLIGVDQFMIFDTDGSFEEPLREYVARGSVEYIPRWPERFAGQGSALERESRQRKILLEVEAENYCVWRYRGRADWVAVLHSPDEFLHVSDVVSQENVLQGSLQRFLEPLDARVRNGAAISHVVVRQALFGGDTNGEAQTVLGRYVYRSDDEEMLALVPHTYIANGLHFAQGGVHPGRGRPGSIEHADESQAPLVVIADPTRDVRVNHYIDTLGRKRCGTNAEDDSPLANCSTFDPSALGAAAVLEQRLRQQGVSATT